MIWVGADGAHLGVSRNFQALSSHGDELSLVTNSEVVAEFVRARSERARLGEGGEFEHVGRIFISEFDDPQIRSGRRGFVAVLDNHLRERRACNELPAGTLQ